MTPHTVLSSILLISVWLAPHIASADSAADTTGKRTPKASAAKPGTYGKAAAGPAPTGSSAMTHGTLRTSKTSLGLRIDYSFDTPATGRATEVRLKVEGNEAGRPLSIEVVPGTGLQMARGLPGHITVQSAPSAEHAMAITPMTDGLHYIHIFLRSGDMTEALAIAVPTGKTQNPAKPVTPTTMPDGRRVMSIPAQQ